MAFQDQGVRQPAALFQHHGKMGVAEPLNVGHLPDVRLHHSRAGDVLGNPVFQGIPHAANGTALLRLEHLADRYGANVFSHIDSSGFIFLTSPSSAGR